MKYKTVFVTERAKVHQDAFLAVAPEMLDIVTLPQPDRETLKTHLADAVYFISERRGKIDADLLSSALRLKLILRLGSQTHDIDLEAAKTHGIIVTFWPQSSVIRVAEHCIMQMLVLVKRLNDAQKIALGASQNWRASRRTDENTFAYNWSKRQNIVGLSQKTIGILGFGEIGFEIAKRLQNWGTEILYHKRNRLPESVENRLNIAYADSETVFRESDILVNLLPYSAETNMFIHADRIAMMRHDALLLSVGSGSVIDELALAHAIKSGKIAGAALDTYEYEPIREDNPLLDLAREGYNVLLTPHVAAGTMSNLDERREHFTNIIRHINGDMLLNRLV